MGRYLFKGLMIGGICLSLMSNKSEGVMGVGDVVSDPGSYVYYADMIGSAAEQLKTAQEMASTASEALSTANKTMGDIQTMNSVLGKPLSDAFLKRFSGFKTLSQSYGGFLSAMGSDQGDRLQSLNSFANREFGTKDQSRLIEGKKYFQHKFFPENSRKIDLGKAHVIKRSREQASKDTVLTSLAVSKQHKEDLATDHQDLVLIARSGNESGTLNHQALVQTKLLERIAQSLEKMILLQSQQLEFMAKTYIGDRGVGIGDLQEPVG